MTRVSIEPIVVATKVAPFDYGTYGQTLVQSAEIPQVVQDALRGKLFLCAVWGEALLAVKMLSGKSIPLRIELLGGGRDGFLLEQTRERWMSFSLPLNADKIVVECVGCQPAIQHDTQAPTDINQMRGAAEHEIRAALAVLLKK